jgi:2-polyprenyl-3-methyl-5-hydroxy-6-metoxy-1,4-benzoquinol methylase
MIITSPNESNCPVCLGTAILPLCQCNDYEIMRCRTCACDFVSPMPNEKALKDYYDGQNYFQGETKGTYSDYDVDTEAVLPLFNDLLDSIPDVTGKKILDIGCAFGTHLAMAAERGWEAWGIELSSYAREIALSRHGKKIQVLENIDSLPGVEFDLVIILDVLEHLPNPYQLFVDLFLHGTIGKKTRLVITTPNARSVDALAEPADWAYRHPPAHLLYFSANSLDLFLNILGGINVDVHGIHPVDYREVDDYPDENNPFNQKFKSYAGLMGIAQGFDTFLYKLLNFFETESISITNAELAKLYREVCGIQREVMQKHVLEQQLLNQIIEEKSAELRKKEEQQQKLYQTKWYRLGEALKTRPMTLHNFAQIIYLSIGLATPHALRAKIATMLAKFRQ